MILDANQRPLIKLSDCPVTTLRVIRDGAFANLGLLNACEANLLAPLHDPAYAQTLEKKTLAEKPNLTAVIATAETAGAVPPTFALAISAAPMQTLYEIDRWLQGIGHYWIPFPSVIAASARVHPRAFVAEENVVIGERVVIEPNATILEGTVIGNDSIVRAGVVIGSEGFQVPVVDGRPVVIPHTGGARLGCDVEIQSNTVIDRGLLGMFTDIGDHTKIDNLVHIAHSARIGKCCRIAGGSMIAGSVVIGDSVWMGPGSSISSGLTIGDGAWIILGELVTRSVAPGMAVAGRRHQPKEEYFKMLRGLG